jgi:acyl-coenzyme A thioesterase PaaI-like protein
VLVDKRRNRRSAAPRWLQGLRRVGNGAALLARVAGAGGIISTVLDCHGAAVVMWEAEQHEWRAAPGAPVPFITAGFEVRFLRPTPLGPTVRLAATRVSIDETEIVVTSELEVDGKPRATMTATWKCLRPR